MDILYLLLLGPIYVKIFLKLKPIYLGIVVRNRIQKGYYLPVREKLAIIMNINLKFKRISRLSLHLISKLMS
ncbi:hypothetical protein L2E82_42254 [Cichorium intybus]|uniref:Uncharacterized protein n=1 Tax=Cichorium intybus TaxID=13427 RepID=A0ACB8ZM73_CICIN|nr:hypothetical protein L2E82_42254 [Cichorium intybus]